MGVLVRAYSPFMLGDCAPTTAGARSARRTAMIQSRCGVGVCLWLRPTSIKK